MNVEFTGGENAFIHLSLRYVYVLRETLTRHFLYIILTVPSVTIFHYLNAVKWIKFFEVHIW